MKKALTKIVKGILFSLVFLIILMAFIFGYKDILLEDLKSKYASSPSLFISVDQMDVHYRDEGEVTDSIPIVLIHGTGSSLHTYNEWTNKLISDHRVIRMDLPGYGLTGPFTHRHYSIENYVLFLKHFLNALGVKSCVLAGNSLGGQIVWSFTSEYPDMVEEMILIDAAGYPSEAESTPIAFKIAQIPVVKNIFTFITPRSLVKSSIENVYDDKTKVTKELVDRYFELTLRKGNRQAFIDRFSVRLDTSSYEKIKLIEKRTLVLWGQQDKLIPLKMAYRFHNDLPNDTLVILRNVGHVPMEESPYQSLKPVIAFLKK
ncbi:MAG: alpha/beta hydrolase [Crocinitomicaceae bacterium]|jgi:pimeloyl-ACP methyl ester carboxylesterase|tara:strand:- start:674 stop:1624 length:951 start_codon:yes stop_codon:yes gene_type:complete